MPTQTSVRQDEEGAKVAFFEWSCAEHPERRVTVTVPFWQTVECPGKTESPSVPVWYRVRSITGGCWHSDHTYLEAHITAPQKWKASKNAFDLQIVRRYQSSLIPTFTAASPDKMWFSSRVSSQPDASAVCKMEAEACLSSDGTQEAFYALTIETSCLEREAEGTGSLGQVAASRYGITVTATTKEGTMLKVPARMTVHLYKHLPTPQPTDLGLSPYVNEIIDHIDEHLCPVS